MRLMLVIVGLLLAASALAEEKPKNVTVAKELDKSSPILMSTESTDDSTEATDAKGRAQDYNSSRSNNIEIAAPAGDLDGDGRPDVVCAKANGNGVDDDCDSAIDEAPANHNTTRSNRTLRVTQPSGSATGQSRGGATRAQDYNSSRSNTTSLRLDDDSDGDSIDAEVRCSMRSDECIDAGDNDDRVVRKKPGR